VRFKRSSFGILLVILLTASCLFADEWREVSKNSNLTIYARHRPGSSLEELRAVGDLNATALKVETVLGEVSKYPEFMPYTKESRLLAPGSQLCYMLLSPPIVGERDYTIRVSRESRKGDDGSTTYYSHWEIANAEGPPPRPGVNRVKIMKGHGSWSRSEIGLGQPMCFTRMVAAFQPSWPISQTSKAFRSCLRRFGRVSSARNKRCLASEEKARTSLCFSVVSNNR
jgi:hypothetical protein